MTEQGKLNNRSIRVFISSTFKDMIEDRNELMSHCWPEIRKFCQERQVEFTEVDLRWGITEKQSSGKETLKLCINEIKNCKPYFIGLLGERYGWVPSENDYTQDLYEEQSWLKGVQGKSITELEILFGVLQNPEMAGRALFCFRDSNYAQARGADFMPENNAMAEKQRDLKSLIRDSCNKLSIPIKDYSHPQALARIILEHLKRAIETEYPIDEIPDKQEREDRDHEAYAEIRRRTYIKRQGYYSKLNEYCLHDGKPVLLSGESGSGKSALLANWVDKWREEHPQDVIFQHYVGGTADSTSHWKLLIRLIIRIKNWLVDTSDLPASNDDILKQLPHWLTKAQFRATKLGVRFIIVLDALNQLEDKDHALVFGWLQQESYYGNLKLLMSSIAGGVSENLRKKGFEILLIEPLRIEERKMMIDEYLKRFGKALDQKRTDRIAQSDATKNPLFLKILLDELRVTGTFDNLDERLGAYLRAKDIPSLLQAVLMRYCHDYERDYPGLVSRALSLIWAARRGLSEKELLEVLHPVGLKQLPMALWSPFRAALDESLVDRGGILNFAHEFIRNAVMDLFVNNLDAQDDARITLADYFEAQENSVRVCDELPWLLSKTESYQRLRECLLNIGRFIALYNRDEAELRRYWIELGDTKTIGAGYLSAFYLIQNFIPRPHMAYTAYILGKFLFSIANYHESEVLLRRSIETYESIGGKETFELANVLSSLAGLLDTTKRSGEALECYERALAIDGLYHESDSLWIAEDLQNVVKLLYPQGRYSEAEPLILKAIENYKTHLGEMNGTYATAISTLALLYQETERLSEAELLMRRALEISENCFESTHSQIGTRLNNLGRLLVRLNRYDEAESMQRRAYDIYRLNYGYMHPIVAIASDNLAQTLYKKKLYKEAEFYYNQAIEIDVSFFGSNHPKVAIRYLNLSKLLLEINRLQEAESTAKKSLDIMVEFCRTPGNYHPLVISTVNNYANILMHLGWTQNDVEQYIEKHIPEIGRK